MVQLKIFSSKPEAVVEIGGGDGQGNQQRLLDAQQRRRYHNPHLSSLNNISLSKECSKLCSDGVDHLHSLGVLLLSAQADV